MVLQMLYLLICQMKFIKRQELIGNIVESVQLLQNSVDLFITIFLNYRPGVNSKRTNEDVLFDKLMKDELRVEILQYQQHRQQQLQNDDSDDDDDDDEDGEDVLGHGRGEGARYYKSIDWDNENLDEDLKYLKICKFIKYKSQSILEQYNASQLNHQQNKHHHQEQPAGIPQNPFTPVSSSVSGSDSGSGSSHSMKLDLNHTFPNKNGNNSDTNHKDFGAAHDLMDLKRSYSNRNLNYPAMERHDQSI